MIALVGGLVTMIPMFLPWFTVSGGTYSISLIGLLAGGIFTLLSFVFAILVIVFAAIKRPLLAGIFGLLALILLLLPVLTFTALAAAYQLVCGTTCVVSFSPLMWVSLIGALLAMIGGFVGWRQQK